MSQFKQVPAQTSVEPVPEGAPYHLLARNAAHTWWRPLVAILVAALLGLVSMIVALVVLALLALLPPGFAEFQAVLLLLDPDAVDAFLRDQFVLLFISFGTLVAMLPAVLLTARWVQKRPAASLASVTGRVRSRWLGESMIGAFVVLGVAFAISAVISWLTATPTGPGFPGWANYGRVALLALFIAPLQSAAEEFVFRGFLLQTITAWFRTPWVAIAVTSVLFLAGHGYTDPLVWCELLVMAAAMCWLTLRTGGLEAGIALHVANNVLSLLVGGLSGVPSVEQAGDFAVGDVLPFIAAVLCYAWWADRRAQRRELATVTGGRTRMNPWSLQVEAPEKISVAG